MEGVDLMTNRFSDPRADAILDIIAAEAGVDRAALVPDATLDALAIPSLDLIHTLFAIETHFDVEIPVVADREGAEFVTVGGLVGHILATLDRSAVQSANSKSAAA
jgi:acyl carrier protein